MVRMTAASARLLAAWTQASRALTAVIAAASLLVAAWSAAPAASAAPPAPVRGVTPTSVLIGSDQPITGPAAAAFGEIAPASKAFFEYVNARGGVHGRDIDYITLDNANNPATALADERELVFGDTVFAFFSSFGLTTHEAIVEDLNAEGVPDLFVASSCDCWNEPFTRPETFGFGSDFTVEGRLLGDYVAQTFPAAKVAYLTENLLGEGANGLDRQIPSSQVVARQSFAVAELAATRLLPQVNAAQEAGAQVLVLDALEPQATALVLLDGAAIGYHPRILVTSTLRSADPTTVGRFITQFSGGKASPALENGLITQDSRPSASDEANPWIVLFRKIHDTYEPQEPFDSLTVYGMTSAFTFVEALRHAGPHPTRESIVDAIDDGFVNFGGPGLAPFDFSPFNHAGYGGEQVGTVREGAVVLSGPVRFTHDAGPILTLPPSDSRPPARLAGRP